MYSDQLLGACHTLIYLITISEIARARTGGPWSVKKGSGNSEIEKDHPTMKVASPYKEGWLNW